MELYLIRRSHSVGKNTWHIEWCTKYRYAMMCKEENRQLVKACIRQAAHRHGIKILTIEVLPQHAHMIVELPHGMTDDKAVNLLKGYSAWKIFQVKEHFRLRYPKGHFWSRGYMARTVGLDEEQAIGYVENQLGHHGVVFM
jgi:putative transposase